MKKILLLSILGAFFISGCTSQTIPDDYSGGLIEAQNGLVFDFGDIDILDGTVSRKFNFTNTDTKPLVISEITTSCGCTTGTIDVGTDQFGPFGMHNQSTQFIEVPAGKSFVVTIIYDPLFHGPNDVGQRKRTLFLFSSAKADGKIVREYKDKPNFTEISVTGNVVAD